MSFHILGDQGWPETPTTGMCCMGSAMGGAGRCTCWEPVYDLEQAEPQLDAPTVTRSSMCDDCAYRPGSPERAGQEDAGADEEGLDALVYSGSPFTCHKGIRRPIRWLHPSGVEIPGSPLDYRPPIHGARPYQANGLPAEVCGGWALRRARYALRELERRP